MTSEEQDLHLAKLIVQECKSYKRINCLTSKSREIKDSILEVLSNPWNHNLPEIRTSQSDLLDTDLRVLFTDIEEEIKRQSVLLNDIEKIEPGYRIHRK